MPLLPLIRLRIIPRAAYPGGAGCAFEHIFHATSGAPTPRWRGRSSVQPLQSCAMCSHGGCGWCGGLPVHPSAAAEPLAIGVLLL